MKGGAKPSSGLVHLHKSFVELHFRALPQTVSVQACIDGRNLATVLPGQVYSTSCGQDHWLLGLQYIFKAYKEPVITHVDMHGDSQVLVSISSQGLQDKYASSDPAQRAELQRALEAAAFKFAQTAVMRKEGRLQISGPNINIPKKQLRAQWPAILERLAPQDVTAHIFVDSPDSYIACAAKIILTKAKAEPVFYLSGLSQLLKAFTGAFVSLELLPQEGVVRLNIDTGQRQASLSTTAGAMAASEAAETSSAAAAAAAESQAPQEVQQSVPEAPALHQAAAAAAAYAASLPASACAASVAGVDSLLPQASVSGLSGQPAAAAWAALQRPPVQAGGTSTPRKLAQLPPAGNLVGNEAAAGACLLLEGMASSSIAPAAAGAANRGSAARSAGSEGQAESGSSMQRPQPATPGRSTGHCRPPSPKHDVAAAAPSPGPAAAAAPAAVAGAAGVAAPEPDAGLWLLADHAAQLQARGSMGNLSAGTATGNREAAAAAAAPPAGQGEGPAAARSKRVLPAASHPPRAKAREPVASGDGSRQVPAGDAEAAGSRAGDGWLLHPKRRRTARAAAAAAASPAPGQAPAPAPEDVMQLQQLYSGASEGYQLHGGYFHYAAPHLAQQHVADAAHMHPEQCLPPASVAAATAAVAAAPSVPAPGQAEAPAAGLLLAAAAAAEAAAAAAAGSGDAAAHVAAPAGGSDDVRALARHHEQQADGGEAVAVVHRVSSVPGSSALKSDAEAARQHAISQQLLQQYHQQLQLHQQSMAGHMWQGGPQDAAFYDSHQAHAYPADAGRYHLCSSPGLPPGHLPPAHWQQQGQGYTVGFPPAGLHAASPAAMHQPAWLQPACLGPVHGSSRPGKPSAPDAAGAAPQLPPMALPHSVHDWGPATMLGSPHSGSSSITRATPISTGGSCSPAAAAAAAAASAGMQHVLTQATGPDHYSSSAGDPRAPEQHWQHWQHPPLRPQRPQQQLHSSRPLGGPGAPGAVAAGGAFSGGGAALAAGADQPVRPGAGWGSHLAAFSASAAGAAAAASEEPTAAPGPHQEQEQQQEQQQQQQQQEQHWPAFELVGGQDEARLDCHGGLLLPDADNLLVVGKSLVQVMNLLGAGSEARLAVTRSLRAMSPQDREWLVAVTYPHLQDSCRRRALGEVAMILNELAGGEWLRPAAPAPAGNTSTPANQDGGAS